MSVSITAVTTLLAPLVTPALIWLLASEWLPVSFSAMFMSILKMVLLPIILGLIAQRLLGARVKTAVEVLPIPEGVDLEEGQLMRITDVTEKPPLEEVKSEYAVVGRYLLDPAVFTALENIVPGAGGEYQLTDGYARMIDLPEEEGGGLYGVVIDERRFDTGDKLGYLEANVTLALEDPALGAELKEFLRSKLED